MSDQKLMAQLEQFRALNTEGRYQESIHRYLMRDFDSNDDINSPLMLEIHLHYAMALQHAGLFLNAGEYFQIVRAQSQLFVTERGDKYDCIRQTAVLHLAVIMERLKKPQEALDILDELGDINSCAVKLAWASPISFVDITYMKCHLQAGQLDKIEPVVKRALSGDENQQLWGRLFRSILQIKNGEMPKIDGARRDIEDVLELIERADPHGAPWFSLTAGQYLIDEDNCFARMLLERSERKGMEQRKLFIVADASYNLFKIFKAQGNLEGAARCIRRAVGGFQRCGVLLRPPLQEEVYRSFIEMMGENKGRHIFTLTAGIIDPHSLKFGQMCSAHARLRTQAARSIDSDAKEILPWQIFEEFVLDWARVEYPGNVVPTSRGQEGVDVIVNQNDGGVFIQAKLWERPKSAVPKNVPLKAIVSKYGPIKKFVFVVATSRESGWEDSDWDTYSDNKVFEALPNWLERPVFDQATTEPTLQSHALLESSLFDKYFRYHLS